MHPSLEYTEKYPRKKNCRCNIDDIVDRGAVDGCLATLHRNFGSAGHQLERDPRHFRSAKQSRNGLVEVRTDYHFEHLNLGPLKHFVFLGNKRKVPELEGVVPSACHA